MNFLRTLTLLCSLALACTGLSQAAVRYIDGAGIWVLDTEHTSYVLGRDAKGLIQHMYWGARIARAEDFGTAHAFPEHSSFDPAEGEEYPGWGGFRYVEPCLKVTFDGGVRDLVLQYSSHEVSENTLVLRLKDIKQEFFVELTYRVFPADDLIRKSARIVNRTGKPVLVESAQSGTWQMPQGEGYRLSYLSGRWAAETQLIREPVHPGKKVLESRRGNTSHHANPWFAIDYRGEADERHGRVWFGALGWSGNWKLTVEQSAAQKVSVTGGYNDFDFAYPLKPGEALETPPFYGGFTEGGFGEASRTLHRFVRRELLPDRAQPRVRPVLYNSWEATTFAVTEQGQKELAEKAAKIGVEMFVMDDGWFGARDNDRAGLGDWTVNPKKFPNGLKPLIDTVHGLGMKFGLWVEPEMINPDSDLYRKHPDWVMNFPGRPRSEARNQLVLNLARDDVKEYIFGVLDKLASENRVDFYKWDMNRHFSEPGWPEAPEAERKELWLKYVTNLYDIIDRLRAKHPALEIESCSGGGGRVDMGILTRVDQVWTSDNTDAYDRLRIQEGFTTAYPPKVMMAWVTDVPNMNGRSTPLKYRFLVAMTGSLGIGANLNHWSPADFQLAKEMLERYKNVRGTVQGGKLYRLASPRESDFTASQYVAEDGKQSVLFAFLRSQQYDRQVPAVYLEGLDEKAVYRVTTIDDKLVNKSATLSGAALMHRGLELRMRGDFDSTMVVLDRLE
ncbi:MAG TPA: alpha-galactosidase [Bryobacteraceae bacterium]|nr:alpha-galactosidase [Bryobacteraceae bacterium]